MICLSLGLPPNSTREDALRTLRRCRRYAEIVELRLDLLPRDCIQDLIMAARRPVIAACRLHDMGGAFRGTCTEAFQLLTRAIIAGAEFVDIDLRDYRSWKKYVHGQTQDRAQQVENLNDVKVVVSHHDFRGTPRNAERIFRRLVEENPYCAKFCVTTRTVRDAVRLLRIADAHSPRQRRSESGVKRVIIGMGEPGRFSRILYKRLGSDWSYGSVAVEEGLSFDGFATLPRPARPSDTGHARSFDSAEKHAAAEMPKQVRHDRKGLSSAALPFGGGAPMTTTAPGQIDVRTLATLYRANQLDTRTAVFAVVGAPLAHTRSPEYFNGLFQRHGLDGIFIPLEIPDLASFDELARLIRLRGASITMPHKTAILRHVRRLSPEAAAMSAVNTIVWDGWDGRGYVGHNTDALGLRSLLKRHGPLNAARALVLGAGGAARATVHELVALGADVTVSNRTPGRAAVLVQAFGCRTIPWEGRSGFRADILVNATSVGMGTQCGPRTLRGIVQSGAASLKVPLGKAGFRGLYSEPGSTRGELPGSRAVLSQTAGTHPTAVRAPESSEVLIPAAGLHRPMLVIEWVHTPEETALVLAARRRGCGIITGVDLFKAQARFQWKLFKDACGDR